MEYRPEYDRELIGRNLRRYRQAKNLSVEQVREYLQLGSIQSIYKWEEGRGYPQTDTMFALMELYEIGLGNLLHEEVSREWTILEENISNIYLEYESQEENLKRKRKKKMRRMKKYYESNVNNLTLTTTTYSV